MTYFGMFFPNEAAKIDDEELVGFLDSDWCGDKMIGGVL